MSSSNKQGKMIGYINWRMRVILNDNRQMFGQMLAFDKHMNLVLADTEEFRHVRRKQTKPAAAPGGKPIVQVIESDEKRTLGLVILRGAQIVSVSAESPPPADPSARLGRSAPGGLPSTMTSGPGVARPIGRGAPPSSLAGPAAGVGGANMPPGFPNFPPNFLARGGPPPGYNGPWPPSGFPNIPSPAGMGAPGGMPPGPPGGPPGGFPGGLPGLQPTSSSLNLTDEKCAGDHVLAA